jgi:hypothetical protein
MHRHLKVDNISTNGVLALRISAILGENPFKKNVSSGSIMKDGETVGNP